MSLHILGSSSIFQSWASTSLLNLKCWKRELEVQKLRSTTYYLAVVHPKAEWHPCCCSKRPWNSWMSYYVFDMTHCKPSPQKCSAIIYISFLARSVQRFEEAGHHFAFGSLSSSHTAVYFNTCMVFRRYVSIRCICLLRGLTFTFLTALRFYFLSWFKSNILGYSWIKLCSPLVLTSSVSSFFLLRTT